MLRRMKSELPNTKHLGQNVPYHFARKVICVLMVLQQSTTLSCSDLSSKTLHYTGDFQNLACNTKNYS